MNPPALPSDEEARLKSLESLEVLDTPAEERFDRVTRLSRRVFGVPIALVSLVDRDRQWFKSAQGLAACQTSREISFCGHAILGSSTFVVEDAALDPRFSDNPLVTGDPKIRFYAGRPLRGADGHRVGTLCIIDRSPRTMSAEDLRTLEDLAVMVEEELKVIRMSRAEREMRTECERLKRLALVDTLTRVWNRGAIVDVLTRELGHAQREQTSVAVIMADLDHFKNVNDTHGHPAGDAVLLESARRFKMAVRPYDAVGRYGGEEFLIVLPGADIAQARVVGERIRDGIASVPFELLRQSIPMTVSLGASAWNLGTPVDPLVLVAAADAALYRAKSAGRNRIQD